LLLLPVLLQDGPGQLSWAGIVIGVEAAIATNLVIGYSGQFAILSGAMMGVGAFSAIVLLRWGVWFGVALLVAASSAGFLGLLFSFVLRDLAGLYLALASVGLSQAVSLVMLRWTTVTGGSGGSPVPLASLTGGVGQVAPTVLYVLVAALTGTTLFVSLRIVTSQWGRVLKAMNSNPTAARACGVNLEHTKRTVLIVGCFVWGLAGGMYALWAGYVSPDDFALGTSVRHLTMIVVGGMGTYLGPILGGLVIGGVSALSPISGSFQPLVYAALIFSVMLFFRGAGLLALIASFGDALRRTRARMGRRPQ
jgi:branched-chain amino acid transport system permease protein